MNISEWSKFSAVFFKDKKTGSETDPGF